MDRCYYHYFIVTHYHLLQSGGLISITLHSVSLFVEPSSECLPNTPRYIHTLPSMAGLIIMSNNKYSYLLSVGEIIIYFLSPLLKTEHLHFLRGEVS